VVAVYTVCVVVWWLYIQSVCWCSGCINSVYVDVAVYTVCMLMWWLYIQSVCLCYGRAGPVCIVLRFHRL
jgi:hypothetical protein